MMEYDARLRRLERTCDELIANYREINWSLRVLNSLIEDYSRTHIFKDDPEKDKLAGD